MYAISQYKRPYFTAPVCVIVQQGAAAVAGCLNVFRPGLHA